MRSPAPAACRDQEFMMLDVRLESLDDLAQISRGAARQVAEFAHRKIFAAFGERYASVRK